MERLLFENLVSDIISKEFENAWPVYNFEKEELLSSIFDPSVEASTDIDYPNQFGSEASDIADYIKLILGTYEFVKALVKGVKSKRIEKSKEKWLQHLIKSGLPGEKAKHIVNEYFDQIDKCLKEKD